MNDEEIKIIDRTLIVLKHLMDKHEDATKLQERAKIQHFGRLCRSIDVAIRELGWNKIEVEDNDS
tara:strand:- start:280 stop:474 length:195 start_codon:yes stop_codon:yes gene_type:complete